MATTRAKFRVTEIRRHEATKAVKGDDGKTTYVPCEARSLVMSPVYGNGDPGHENTKFWQWSPSGKLELCVVNLAAVEHFDIGKEYYVDITEAP